jgi:hypothetical protein
VCSGVIGSTACCMSTTDKLHEWVSAPYELLLGAALLPAGLLRGTTDGIDPDWLRSLSGVGLRVAAVSVVGATMGASIATIGRNTAAALGIAFGYLAIVENAIRGLRPNWTPWLLGDNIIVVITNQTQNTPWSAGPPWRRRRWLPATPWRCWRRPCSLSADATSPDPVNAKIGRHLSTVPITWTAALHRPPQPHPAPSTQPPSPIGCHTPTGCSRRPRKPRLPRGRRASYDRGDGRPSGWTSAKWHCVVQPLRSYVASSPGGQPDGDG